MKFHTTSNIQQPSRHPMNFKEKKGHIMKMGVAKQHSDGEITICKEYTEEIHMKLQLFMWLVRKMQVD